MILVPRKLVAPVSARLVRHGHSSCQRRLRGYADTRSRGCVMLVCDFCSVPQSSSREPRSSPKIGCSPSFSASSSRLCLAPRVPPPGPCGTLPNTRQTRMRATNRAFPSCVFNPTHLHGAALSALSVLCYDAPCNFVRLPATSV